MWLFENDDWRHVNNTKLKREIRTDLLSILVEVFGVTQRQRDKAAHEDEKRDDQNSVGLAASHVSASLQVQAQSQLQSPSSPKLPKVNRTIRNRYTLTDAGKELDDYQDHTGAWWRALSEEQRTKWCEKFQANVDEAIDSVDLCPNVQGAMEYLFGIPASSASAERRFSSLGTLYGSRRWRLSPKHVEMHLIVRDWLMRASIEERDVMITKVALRPTREADDERE